MEANDSNYNDMQFDMLLCCTCDLTFRLRSISAKRAAM